MSRSRVEEEEEADEVEEEYAKGGGRGRMKRTMEYLKCIIKCCINFVQICPICRLQFNIFADILAIL